MELVNKEVREGKYNDKIVWVCHYNQPDFNKKPLRAVPPTECLVRDTDHLPKGKRVYYSTSFLSPLKANGEPYSKVISLVDNTGYRSYCGNEIHVFKDKEECVASWQAQIDEHADRVSEITKDIEKQWQARYDALIKLK